MVRINIGVDLLPYRIANLQKGVIGARGNGTCVQPFVVEGEAGPEVPTADHGIGREFRVFVLRPFPRYGISLKDKSSPGIGAPGKRIVRRANDDRIAVDIHGLAEIIPFNHYAGNQSLPVPLISISFEHVSGPGILLPSGFFKHRPDHEGVTADRVTERAGKRCAEGDGRGDRFALAEVKGGGDEFDDNVAGRAGPGDAIKPSRTGRVRNDRPVFALSQGSDHRGGVMGPGNLDTQIRRILDNYEDLRGRGFRRLLSFPGRSALTAFEKPDLFSA